MVEGNSLLQVFGYAAQSGAACFSKIVPQKVEVSFGFFPTKGSGTSGHAVDLLTVGFEGVGQVDVPPWQDGAVLSGCWLLAVGLEELGSFSHTGGVDFVQEPEGRCRNGLEAALLHRAGRGSPLVVERPCGQLRRARTCGFGAPAVGWCQQLCAHVGSVGFVCLRHLSCVPSC